MTWLLEVYAALHAGFGFLAYNYAQCSSTQLLQIVLIAVASLGVARIALRWGASERMRRRLAAVELGREPKLAAAMHRAAAVVGRDRPIDCRWSDMRGLRLATLGYFRPSLIIARDVVDELAPEELEAALAHELLHARRRDALRADLGGLLFALSVLAAGFALLLFLAFYAGAFAMNRLLALAAASAGLLIIWFCGSALIRWMECRAEFACDRAAAAGQGGALAAAAALVKVARLERGQGRRFALAATPLYSAETFDRRVRRLIEGRDTSALPRRSRPLQGLAALALAAVAMTGTVDLRQAAAQGCATCALVLDKTARWAG